jgi:hypothetical protein
MGVGCTQIMNTSKKKCILKRKREILDDFETMHQVTEKHQHCVNNNKNIN